MHCHWMRDKDEANFVIHKNTATRKLHYPETAENRLCFSVSFHIKRVLIFSSNVLDGKMSFMFFFPRFIKLTHSKLCWGTNGKKAPTSASYKLWSVCVCVCVGHEGEILSEEIFMSHMRVCEAISSRKLRNQERIRKTTAEAHKSVDALNFNVLVTFVPARSRLSSQFTASSKE